MRFLVSLLLLCTSCAFALDSSASPAKVQQPQTATSGPKQQALELKQTHFFFGDVQTTASKTAIRMEDTGSWKFVLVARAPDWKVTVFRDDDKLYFTCPLQTFLEGGMVSQFLVTKRGEYINGGRKETLSTSIGGNHVVRIMGPVALCEYLPNDKLVAPQIVKILYETFRLPTNGGLTLRFVQAKQGTDWMTGLKEDGQQVMLSTKSARMVSVPSKIFDAPTGYKLSKSLREVLISKDTRDSSGDAKDLFEIK